MPDLTLTHLGLAALALLAGVVAGWALRTGRVAREKLAINAGWQEQLAAQQSEHERLATQNKSLMEQISQYQAAHRDYGSRAKELADALKEAYANRDEVQRKLKVVKGSLDVALAQRDRLQQRLADADPGRQAAALKDRDDRIVRLSRELTSWQSRVPPLVERFQEKNRQVSELEAELAAALERLREFEAPAAAGQTRVGPAGVDVLAGNEPASNEPLGSTAEYETPPLRDQIDEDRDGVVPDDEDDDPDEDQASDEWLPEMRPADQAENDDDGGGETEDEWLPDDATADGENDAGPEPAGAAPDETTAVAVGTGDRREWPEEAANTADASEIGVEPQFSETGVEPRFDVEPDGTDGAPGDVLPEIPADNLKRIKGIGPSIEKTLRDLGIVSFRQIADMTELEIDRVARHLRGFRSRIYREDWIGQARELASLAPGTRTPS